MPDETDNTQVTASPDGKASGRVVRHLSILVMLAIGAWLVIAAVDYGSYAAKRMQLDAIVWEASRNVQTGELANAAAFEKACSAPSQYENLNGVSLKCTGMTWRISTFEHLKDVALPAWQAGFDQDRIEIGGPRSLSLVCGSIQASLATPMLPAFARLAGLETPPADGATVSCVLVRAEPWN